MAAIASIVHSVISYDISRSAREKRPLASRSEIRTFILLYFDERTKNLQSLEDLGMLATEVSGVLRNLREDDYSDGPLSDDKGRGLQWWVFGPVFQGACLYVKISLHHGAVICKSFHMAEWDMEYPLKGK